MADTHQLVSGNTPKVVGRYQIVRTLGKTTLGQEYLATFSTAGGLISATRILVFDKEHTEADLSPLRRLKEILTYSHGCLVRASDAGIAGGALYVAYEYQPARDLASLVAAHMSKLGVLPPSLSLHIGMEILRALRYAEHQGKGDECPSHGHIGKKSILITKDGQVKLHQLGLMPAVGPKPEVTKSAAEAPLPIAADVHALAKVVRELLSITLGRAARGPGPSKKEREALEALLSGPLLTSKISELTTPGELMEILAKAQKEHGGAIHPEDAAELLEKLFGKKLSEEATELSEIVKGDMGSNGTLTFDVGRENEIDQATPTPKSIIAGRYVVIGVVGRGGMGNVLEVEHLELGRRLALKLLSPQLSHDPQYLERFRREARAACKIGHRNIVDVVDFGRTQDGRLFYVMELLEGQSLEDIIKQEGALEQRRAVQLLLQVCDALDAAHEVSVVHRDLKPDNLMITVDDEETEIIRVVDFGISQDATAESARVTRTGQIIGTPTYMSPEQVRGFPTDLRTDVYSSGAILYELLTGKPVFKADTVIEVMSAHLKKKPMAPRLRRPEVDIHPLLDTVVLKALEKNPKDRYSSMADLAFDLWAVLEAIKEEGPRGLVGTGLSRSYDALEIVAGTSEPELDDSEDQHLLTKKDATAPTIPAPPPTSSSQTQPIETPLPNGAQLVKWLPHVAVGLAVALTLGFIVTRIVPTTDDDSNTIASSESSDAGIRPLAELNSPDGEVMDFSNSRKSPRKGKQRWRGKRRKAQTGANKAAKRARGNKALKEAQALLRQRKHREAAAAFAELSRRSPSNPALLAGLGQAKFELGQYAAAARHLKRAVTLRPTNNRYRLLLGGALMRTGQVGEAKRQYREVLKRDPDNAVAKRMLDR